MQVPDAALMVGPKRGRRRQRSVDRVRIGLWMGGLLVVGTALFALPLADDVRTSTLEFLSIVTDEPAASDDVAPEADGTEVPVLEPFTFDSSVFVDPRMVGMSPPNEIEGTGVDPLMVAM